MTVEHVTPADESYLELGDYNCLAVVTEQTFNDDGLMSSTPSPATGRTTFPFRPRRLGRK